MNTCGRCGAPGWEARLRAELRRKDKALRELVALPMRTDRLTYPTSSNDVLHEMRELAYAALDGSPAPRMYTEEQVRAAWKRANVGSGRAQGDFLYLDEVLKALLESP